MKKIFILMFMFILLVGTVSASFEFDNIKQANYNDLSLNYPKITIRNSLLWIIPLSPISDISLTHHTSKCLNGICSSEQTFYNYEEIAPVEDIKFVDRQGKEIEIPFELYTYENEIYYEEILDDEKSSIICNDILSKNGTMGKICSQNNVYKTVEKVKQIKIPYIIGTKNLGKKVIRIEANITGYSFVDYIFKSGNIWTKELAGWTTANCMGVGGNDIWIDGDYCVHTFLTDGSFNISTEITNTSILVIAGGGGGGAHGGGGGGAGGYRFNDSINVVVETDYNIVVGSGGTGSNTTDSPNRGEYGENSSFGSLINATGGGAGGGLGNAPYNINGYNGGSGSGAGGNTVNALTGGTGNLGGYTPVEGYGGGSNYNTPDSLGAGGGGGCGGIGGNAPSEGGGVGGIGISNSINGTAITYCIGGQGGDAVNTGAQNSTYGSGGGGGGHVPAGKIGGNGTQGVVIVKYLVEMVGITTTQSYPKDYFNTTDNTVGIGCNFTGVGGENITDVTVLIYNSSNNLDYTNTESGLVLTSYNKTWTTTALIDDTYLWACLGEGTSTDSYAGNRTFTIDTISPTISLDVAQTTTSGLQIVPYNISINYTVSDTHLQSCWYNSTWNSTTTSLTCNQNLTNITINSYGINQTIYVYVNDSFGHESVKSKEVSINAIEIAQSYQTSTTEGNTDTFQINLTIPSSKVITIKNLFYNGTSKGEGTLTTIAGNNYSITKSIEIPDISVAGNRTFYWNISLNDGTNFNSREINQYTTALALDDCSTYGTLVLNYSLKDEATQSVLSLSPNLNSTIDIHVNIFTTDTSTLIINYSKRYTNDTNPQICIVNEALNNSKYLMDTTTRYTATGYSTEYYNVQSFSLTNNSIPQSINLFDLKTADSTDFLITFKDETFDLVDDAVIDITRYYVDEGLFKTVERPKTDSFGQTVGHFVESDVIYTLIISKKGTILATFNDMVAVCADSTIGDCKINLNSFLTGVPTIDFTTEFDLNVATTFDEDARRITTIFSTLSGGVATVQLNATQFTGYGNITVCNHLLTTSSGTLICDIPDSFGNVSVIAKLYSGSRLVKTYTFSIEEEALVTFGYAGIIMVFILVLTLPLMFITSTIGMVIGALLGLIIAALLNIYDGGGIIGAGSTILWAIIAGGILIWKIAQKGEST